MGCFFALQWLSARGTSTRKECPTACYRYVSAIPAQTNSKVSLVPGHHIQVATGTPTTRPPSMLNRSLGKHLTSGSIDCRSLHRALSAGCLNARHVDASAGSDLRWVYELMVHITSRFVNAECIVTNGDDDSEFKLDCSVIFTDNHETLKSGTLLFAPLTSHGK